MFVDAFKNRPRRPLRSIAFAVGAMVCMCRPVAFASPKIGNPAPKLLVSTLNGKEFSVDTLKGKIIIVHFLATWCSACSKEMPILNHFYLTHQNELEIIGVSVDRARDRKKVQDLMHEVSFPIAMLNDTKVNDFGSPESLPLTYMIDQKGVIRKIFETGSHDLTDKSLSDAFTAILSH